MTTPRLTALEDEAWRGFLYAHDRIWREIEEGLAPLGVSMAEYSVLALRGEAGRDGMRMSERARRRVMSTGGFPRMADRRERHRLPQRRPLQEAARRSRATTTADSRT